MTEDEIADMQDDFYLRRLDSGLFTLQLVDYVVGEVCVHGGDEVSNSGLTHGSEPGVTDVSYVG